MIATLETSRLLLRGVQPADAPSLQRHFNDYEVIRWLSHHVPWPYPPNGVAWFIKSILPAQGHARWVWAICLKSRPDEAIGIIELRAGEGCNRGFWLGRAFWGQGIMSEAERAVTAHAFMVLGFERLRLDNARGNARSRRVKEKAGATLRYVEPARFVDPALYEQEVWELTFTAWRRRQ
ncbi:GNAT family N-acetyltransferase [Acidocella sp.]|uniref:GNAT family N-acetyltransferase n=1 Tax=Acidocella sp. TaxID=50710 RepID=UPI00260B5803|nr:GNAT family N-acetyltransferase [Acidocella sp.]